MPAEASRDQRLAELALWLLPAVWSSNYLVARAAVGVVPPHLLAFGRWGLVLLLLGVWTRHTLWAQRHVFRAEALHLIVLGALGMWICGAWVYIGAQGTSALNIGLIYATAPVGISIGGAWLLKEHLSTPQRVGMATALLGTLVVVFRGDPSALLGLQLGAGDLWIVASTASWVLYSLLSRVWPSKLSPTERLCGLCAGGLLCLMPFAAYEAAGHGLPSARGWGLIAVAGIFPGLVSYLAYGFIQRQLGVGRAGLVMYLSPLYAAALAWAVLGEAPRWYHLLGAALIVPGIKLAGQARRA